MKVFAFLYPIKPYIKALVQSWGHEDLPCDRLNELIEIRYRSQGYQIYWLTFSKGDNRTEIDESLLSTRIVFRSADKIVPVGVPFRENPHWKYPETSFMLRQLPSGIVELKMGGFHRYDCVSRFAEYCYRKGVPTMVDEDTTEAHFSTLSIYDSIPNMREFTAEGFGYERLMKDPDLGPDFLESRRTMPWFPQPTGAY